MKRQQLRPLSVGETIDAVFTIYRSQFVTLITIAAVILVPILLVSGLLQLSFVNDMITDVESLESGQAVDFGDVFNAGAIVGTLIINLFVWAASALASGAVVKAVSDTYLGRDPEWQPSIQFAFTRLGPLLLGSFLFALGVGVGFIFLFIPGIFLAVSWAVFAPAVVVEGASGPGGLGRSWELIKGRRWPVFGAFVILYIIVAVASFIIGLILSGLLAAGSGGAFNFGNIILNIITQVLTAPLLAIATVVIYFDLRVRKEAFDVTLLANAVGEQPPPMMDPPGPAEPPPSPPPPPEDPGSAWPPSSDI